MKYLLWLLLALVSFALTGCSQEEILSDLGARESIEVVGVLRRSGVVSERQAVKRGRESRYNILVTSSDKERALHALYEFGYPRNKRMAPEELSKQQGFVPNPPEVNEARLDRLVAIEIERLIEALPGVVEVRALVRNNLGSRLGFTKKNAKASASILVTFAEKNGKARFSEEEIASIVRKSVPGIDARDILVRITRLDVGEGVEFVGGDSAEMTTVPPFGFSVPSSQKSLALKQIIVTVLVIGVCGLLLGGLGGWHGAKRKPGPQKRSKGIAGPSGDFFIEDSTSSSGSLTGPKS